MSSKANSQARFISLNTPSILNFQKLVFAFKRQPRPDMKTKMQDLNVQLEARASAHQ